MNSNKFSLLLIVAILMSLVIWMQQKLVTVQTTNISLPIRYINVSDASPLIDLPSRISFRISGKGFEILKLKLSGIQAQYDVLFLSKENYLLDPEKIKLEVPLTISLLSIEPQIDNSTTFNRSVFKVITVHIEPDFFDKTSRDYFYKNNYKLTLENVEVSGPVRLLQSIKSVKTEPISMDKLRKKKTQLKLVLPNQEISAKPMSVDLVKLDQQELIRVFSHISIKTVKQIDFYPQEVTIKVRGQNDLINSLTPKSFIASLETEDEKNGQLRVKITLPSQIELIEISPKFVTRLNE